MPVDDPGGTAGGDNMGVLSDGVVVGGCIGIGIGIDSTTGTATASNTKLFVSEVEGTKGADKA